MRGRGPILLAALALLGCGAGCGGELPVIGRVADFSGEAADAAGVGTLDSKELLGKPWVADFIFTRCSGPCPLLGAALLSLQGSLPREVRLVSFTVDPEHDTPAVLRDYARALGAAPGRWSFVRLPVRGLYDLAHGSFLLPVMSDPKAPADRGVIHSTRLALVDARGFLRGTYDGLQEGAVKRLRRDAERLLREGR